MMLTLAQVSIHASQFPEAVRLDLLDSLRFRKVNHKFHYDSVKQTQKWLALHEAYSPARTDPNCLAVYEAGFSAAIQRAGSRAVHVVGLGCGGGQKDTALLKRLRDYSRDLPYTPCDVSTPMVLVARQSALKEVPEDQCFPVVCDLATAQELRSVLLSSGKHNNSPEPFRLFTFFGMMPNFEPETILPKFSSLLAPEDTLLMSANLAPGTDYLRGVQSVLPLYDNDLTRDWLMTFLSDLGVDKADGEMLFSIEETTQPVELKRIVANFRFTRERTIQVDPNQFHFGEGDSIRLFFSYRHTPDLMRTLLREYGLDVIEQWITTAGEEGVFLVGKT